MQLVGFTIERCYNARPYDRQRSLRRMVVDSTELVSFQNLHWRLNAGYKI